MKTLRIENTILTENGRTTTSVNEGSTSWESVAAMKKTRMAALKDHYRVVSVEELPNGFRSIEQHRGAYPFQFIQTVTMMEG